MISPTFTLIGLDKKKIDYFQWVLSSAGEVLRRTPSHKVTSNHPTKAVTVPSLATFILKSDSKPFASGFFCSLVVKSIA